MPFRVRQCSAICTEFHCPKLRLRIRIENPDPTAHRSDYGQIGRLDCYQPSFRYWLKCKKQSARFDVVPSVTQPFGQRGYVADKFQNAIERLLTDLSRHFQQRELMRANTRIAYSTRKAYEGYLKKWTEPRWGEYRLLEIRAVEVESRPKPLSRAPGTRCKIRNVMSLLFNHGRRHDLCDRDPIKWVRQSAKRRSAPDILTTIEVQELLANLCFRERTLVLLAVTTGLRRSKLFALKCKDVDFETKQITS